MCSQIVFLFDLNSCRNFLLKPKEELNKKLLSIRLACVRLLTDLDYKLPNLKWGYKFFDSNDSKMQKMEKFACSDVSLENFETFENEICVRYERHVEFLKALEESAQKSGYNKYGDKIAVAPVKILHYALTQILCEFQWETMDMWSPSVRKIRGRPAEKRNYLFIVSDFEDDDEYLFKYFGINCCPQQSNFINTFLPHSLRDTLLKKSDIRLILLNSCLNQNFMGPFSSKVLTLLSKSFQTLKGAMIPLSMLSQPLYNTKLANGLQVTTGEDKATPLSTLSCSFQNSMLPFSSIFEQCLKQPFYSTENNCIQKSSKTSQKSCKISQKCYIDFTLQNAVVPITILEIHKKGAMASVRTSLKSGSFEDKKIVWSKFIVHCVVPKDLEYLPYQKLLCLPNPYECSAAETGKKIVTLRHVNEKLGLLGVKLALVCITECGKEMPGVLTPLSLDSAYISVLDPSLFSSILEPYSKISVTKNPLEDADQECLLATQTIRAKSEDFSEYAKKENSGNTSLQPFSMECLEPWFSPTPFVANSIINASDEVEEDPSCLYDLLTQSVKGSRKISEKSSKPLLSNGVESSSCDKGTYNIEDGEIQNIEEDIADLSKEELLSAIKNIYNSAIESSGNVVTSSKRILNMMVNFYTKHSNASIEEAVSRMFEDSLLMTAKKISEKYEMLDSQEATERKIKECQIQVLLILGIENLKTCPDRLNCVNTVTSLLRVMIFYTGIEDLGFFLHDVIKKIYGNNLYDILVEIGDELNISIFDDAESTNSPSDTISSELNNDDEVFCSAVSSVMSEKSTSSTSSRKGNNSNVVEKKLIRLRSDISDKSRYRQVLLPRSATKNKKGKAAVNKAVRCSPRIAAKKHGQTREKSSKVCRNLFSREKSPKKTPKKSTQPITPKNKRINTLFQMNVADTPSEKQDNSVLQIRKSFISQLLKSPKEIAESPTVKGLDKEITPDSKKRLSLKLFSKNLSSPTARMGIKKCTKRLFSEISPDKAVESSKRHKN